MSVQSKVFEDLLSHLHKSPGLFYVRLCEVAREQSGADLVWLGFLEEDGKVQVRAYSGKHFAYLKDLSINIRDPALSRGPTGRALLTKRAVAEEDLQKARDYDPWRERALYFGWRSSLALPLIYGDEILGVLNFYSSKKGFFDATRISTLETLSGELALALKIYGCFKNLVREKSLLQKRLDQLRESLREKEVYLKHMEKSKDRWLALLGHELRTPLTSILGFTEMLLSGLFGTPSEKERRYLHHIKKNAEFILQILEELQKLARLKHSAATEEERFTFREVEESVRFILSEKLEENEIRLESEGELNLLLQGQSPLFQEVLFNLVSNAIKFGPRGSTVRIRVRKEIDLGGGRWASMEVLDQGPGVKAEDYYRIFKPFVQGGGFYTEKPSGLGLGLSLAREIVEKRGGVLVALPRRKGGRFVVFWPERPVKLHRDLEVLLLEPREEEAYRMILWLAGEGLRAIAFPQADSILTTVREEKGRNFALGLDPWAFSREARKLFLRLEEEGLNLPVLFYHLYGGHLKFALCANFLCLRPLNFPFLWRLRELYLERFETLPSRVFLGAREHLAGETRRLIRSLDLELTYDPEKAEVVALDLGWETPQILRVLRKWPPERPLFVNFSEVNPPLPKTTEAVSGEDFRREVARLLLVAKPEVSRTGSLA